MRKSSIVSAAGVTTPKRPELNTPEKRRPLTPIQKNKGSFENQPSSPMSKDKILSEIISKKKLIGKSVQTDHYGDGDIGVVLVTSDKPTQEYWKLLAEERRVALEEALQENQTLTKKVETLQEENDRLNDLIEDAKTLAEMINNISEEDQNESGIGQDGDDDD